MDLRWRSSTESVPGVTGWWVHSLRMQLQQLLPLSLAHYRQLRERGSCWEPGGRVGSSCWPF